VYRSGINVVLHFVHGVLIFVNKTLANTGFVYID